MTAGPLDRVRRTLLVGVGVAVLLFGICSLLGIRINTSLSLPLGLYVAGTYANAALVEFCPAEPFASLAIRRGYRDAGGCADGGAPLLKPAVAQPGDTVELTEQGIAVNGKLLPKTLPLVKDTLGRTLEHWPFGQYAVSEGSVWVASSYSARSFDSRYFGPVDRRSIRERLRPLFTQ